jgi:ADP-ribose pyrophosphatase
MELREEKLNSSLKFNGRMIKLYVDEVKLPNSHISTREVVRHPGASAVLVVDEGGFLVLERQYRYPVDEILWEIPAGKLDKGEQPFECAKRELTEETGLKAKRWEELGYIYTTPGFSDEKIYLFFASELENGEQNLDEDEFVEMERFSKGDVEKMINDGKIVDSKTIAAFFRAEKRGLLK